MHNLCICIVILHINTEDSYMFRSLFDHHHQEVFTSNDLVGNIYKLLIPGVLNIM